MADTRNRIGGKYRRWHDAALRQIQAEMRRASTDYQQSMRARTSGPTTPESLSVRTGQLRRSIRSRTTSQRGTSVTLEMSIGANAPYARIHEFGGVITPKRTKNLAIPVGPAKTRAGVARFGGGPASILTGLKFIVNRKTGKKLLVQAGRSKKQKMIVMYVLVPSVTIPPRLGFFKTVKAVIDRMRPRIQALLKNIRITES